jgi:hypothetical protein
MGNEKDIAQETPDFIGGFAVSTVRKKLRFCECENGAFSFVAGCELPENRIQATERMDQSSPCAFFIFAERRKTMRKQNDLAKVKQTALFVIFCSNPKKVLPPL